MPTTNENAVSKIANLVPGVLSERTLGTGLKNSLRGRRKKESGEGGGRKGKGKGCYSLRLSQTGICGRQHPHIGTKGNKRGFLEQASPPPLPNPPPLFPFLPIPYPLPISTLATQAISKKAPLLIAQVTQ